MDYQQENNSIRKTNTAAAGGIVVVNRGNNGGSYSFKSLLPFFRSRYQQQMANFGCSFSFSYEESFIAHIMITAFLIRIKHY